MRGYSLFRLQRNISLAETSDELQLL